MKKDKTPPAGCFHNHSYYKAKILSEKQLKSRTRV